MVFNLRKRTPISYYEPEEPSFDEYLYCDQCLDYVYEYCAIHGPLLVVPDDKVPVKTNFPPYVPRAALTIPHVFLHLAPSIIPGAGLGVFCSLTLPRGVRFGPYMGQRTQNVDSMYCWQICNRNNKPSYVVDAADGDRSNWMRYVNCSRHWREQNLLAYQYKGQLYYRTVKIIPRFTELMVFYGSEFASMLHINLSKYNSKKYYREVCTISSMCLNKKSENIIDSASEVHHEHIDTKENEEKDYMNIDQFEVIEDQFDAKEKLNDTDVTIECSDIEKSKITTKDNTSIKVAHIGDNVTITFNNNSDNIGFKCDICQRTFAKAQYLRSHIKRHENPLKYNCESCFFRTNYERKFLRHIEKHTKTFIYSCQTCSYKTDIKRNFTSHCRRYKGRSCLVKCKNITLAAIRKCNICDFETSSHSKFATHKSQHKGNIYNCDHCQYNNHSKYNLSRHILKNH